MSELAHRVVDMLAASVVKPGSSPFEIIPEGRGKEDKVMYIFLRRQFRIHWRKNGEELTRRMLNAVLYGTSHPEMYLEPEEADPIAPEELTLCIGAPHPVDYSCDRPIKQKRKGWEHRKFIGGNR